MRARLAALVLPLALLAGCGGNGVPPGQNFATIQGRAFDVSTNAPVPGVTVTVEELLTATTGSDGTYRITNVPAGPCDNFRVSVPAGFRLQSQPTCGSVVLGQVVTIDIPLTH